MSTGWFKVDRAMIGSDLWRRHLAWRAWLLIQGRVNHRDVTRGGLEYPAGTWTTCWADVADGLTWIRGKETFRPTNRQARYAVDVLKRRGMVKTEPLDPKHRHSAPPGVPHSAPPGVRISLVESDVYETETPPQRTPQEADSVTITRTRELGIERGTSLTLGGGGFPAPVSPSGSPPLRIEKERAPRPPDLSKGEAERLAQQYDLPIPAIHWLAIDWRAMLWVLQRGEPLDEPIRDSILRMSGQNSRAETRLRAVN